MKIAMRIFAIWTKASFRRIQPADWDRLNIEEALRRYYQQSIQGKEYDEVKQSRIENDVRTLSYAMQLRNGDRPKQFANCKVIVLSEPDLWHPILLAYESLYPNQAH